MPAPGTRSARLLPMDDDPPTLRQVPGGGLGGDEDAADIDRDPAVELLDREFREGLVHGDAGIGDQDVEPAEALPPPRSTAAAAAAGSALSAWISKARRPAASMSRATSAALSGEDVGQGHIGALARQTPGDGGADAAAGAGDQRHRSGQVGHGMLHIFNDR